MSDSLSEIRDDERHEANKKAKALREKIWDKQIEEENELLSMLALVHNKFCDTERLHQNEMTDWVYKLHDLQRIIMCRGQLRAIKYK